MTLGRLPESSIRINIQDNFVFDRPNSLSTSSLDHIPSPAKLQSSVANQMKKLISKGSLLSNDDGRDKSSSNAAPTSVGDKFLVQVRDGNMEQIRKTLDQNPEVINFSNSYGVTALMLAVEKEHNDLVRFLIERDADVNAISKNFQKETSLSRAAKAQNKELVRVLVERGAEIQQALNCICNPQIGNDWVNDEKAFSLTGVKMLVSPPILAATKEPILTAFSVSNKLYILAKRREEYRDIYSSLAQECETFAYSFLDQCENLWEARRLLSREMKIIDKAISSSKKEFVAHPFVQSLLKEQNFGRFMNSSIWNKISLFFYWWFSVLIFPFYGVQYLMKDPRQRKLRYSDLGEYIDFMGTPVLCLIADSISFILCFAFLLAICLQEELPTRSTQFEMFFEYILWSCIVGQIYTEFIQLRKLGWKNYLTHFWNQVDILIIVLLFATAGVRIYTINKIEPGRELTEHDEFYQSIAWIMYGTLGFLQTIKFLSLTDSNNVIGPLQLAMKSMIGDLMQIMLLLIIILVAFSVTIMVLMKQIPHLYPGEEIPNNFKSLPNTIATLLWALFGFIDFIEKMRDDEDKKMGVYVIFYIIFTAYLLMSAVLLLNMLIAMLTTTFERIQHQSDVEWKFARALMFRGYMGGQSYPAPFNLLCHMSIIIFSRMFRCSNKPLLGDVRYSDKVDQYREKLIKDLRKRFYVTKNMAVGKKVGGLINQYQDKISGKSGSDTKPSLPKQDRALTALQEGGIRDLSKSGRNRI
ncbi:transient receptor potential-gamma protein-like isoform X3 [Bolinopsis microptera]|uniref:transient receptor potential-gamma protein-like isoform X3 n=1 Tax=Bolinopsis microptera TaxID=2820187 RepID=UPI00307A314B